MPQTTLIDQSISAHHRAATMASSFSSSTLFQPLPIAAGKTTLAHRVILAPLTRNRGAPLDPSSSPEIPNRVWVPTPLMAEYYAQRSSPGGLLITEGVPPSLEVRASSLSLAALHAHALLAPPYSAFTSPLRFGWP